MTEILLIVYVVLSGLIAGFFFAYWCSVMIGLRNVSDAMFVNAMQHINAVLPNARFVLPFFAPPVLGLITTWQLFQDTQRAAAWWSLASAVLSVCTFVITAGFNVPLNNRLAAAGEIDTSAARAMYEHAWVRWNDVRTATSFLALVAGVIALSRLA